MLDANAATMIRPVALVKISSNASTTSRSDPVKPRRSMLVLSANSASTPARAELGEPVQVELLAVDRRLVDLEIARVDERADRRVNRQRDAVRHAVRHANELDLERPDGHAVARTDRHQSVRAVEAVLLSFGSTSASVSGVAVHGPLTYGSDVRDGADVILVAVRQHEGRLRAPSAADT